MATMSQYFTKEDLTKRKESEHWAREKADEYAKANSDLTFAEWCYRQGRTDERAKTIDEAIENVIPTLCENDVDDETIEQCKRLFEQMKGEQND